MESYDSRQILKDPLSFTKLVGDGVEFEVDLSERNYEDDSDYEDCMEEVDPDKLVSPWQGAFDDLRALMQPIAQHIFKRIIRPGHEDRDPVPDKARVSLRYSGYWEGETIPFDSSLMRRTKFDFVTGQDAVLEGLETAVRTMRPYEQAEFIISYKVLFRELGCPPRIKPKADGLFKVEVFDYVLVGDGLADQAIAKEDRDKFCVVYSKAQDLNLHGKDCVKRSSFHSAATAFEKAVNLLNYCRLANAEEERRHTALLLTLSQNLMICYNKLDRSRRVCIVMKDVRRLTGNKPSCKALFHEARALKALGEYERAREVIMQAHVKDPMNMEINNEICLLGKCIEKYKKASRDLWSRALWGSKAKEMEPTRDPEKEANEKKQKQVFEELIADFERCEMPSMGLSRKMYSDDHVELLASIAKERNMKLAFSPIHEDLLTLSKTESK